MNQLLKRTLALALVLASVTVLLPSKIEAAPQKKLFMVSAYYSPLPNQKFYMRGNYEADKILNGRGTNGADGTEVYIGMLAAPKSYPFGTKIKIPGLGVGTVHDRGGAIIARKNYDRIDVWMGKGEEGLSRALNWGMRLVEGEVDFSGQSMVDNLDYSWVKNTLPSGTLKRLMAKTTVNTVALSKPITVSSPKINVEELQETLRLLGYYHGPISGKYDELTKESVTIFQLSEGIISQRAEQGSGVFGPKTSSRLSEIANELNSNILKQQKILKEDLGKLTSGIGKDSEGEKVLQLQKMLWELGYYQGPFHHQYDVMTTEAVFDFQKDYGVLNDSLDRGAGYFGPKTHQAMTAAVNKKAVVIAKGPKQMQSWVPADVPLPKLSELSFNQKVEKMALSFDLNGQGSTYAFTKDINPNDQGEIVVNLQNKLIRSGFLSEGLNTGYFGSKTRQALIAFQIDKKVIENKNSLGAGRVGPGTRQVLNAL